MYYVSTIQDDEKANIPFEIDTAAQLVEHFDKQPAVVLGRLSVLISSLNSLIWGKEFHSGETNTNTNTNKKTNKDINDIDIASPMLAVQNGKGKDLSTMLLSLGPGFALLGGKILELEEGEKVDTAELDIEGDSDKDRDRDRNRVRNRNESATQKEKGIRISLMSLPSSFRSETRYRLSTLFKNRNDPLNNLSNIEVYKKIVCVDLHILRKICNYNRRFPAAVERCEALLPVIDVVLEEVLAE